MAIVTQHGAVDLVPEYNRQLRPVFCVSEGDAESRVINLTITSAGEAFPIPSGSMVYVAGKKKDNTVFTYRCSFTANTVVFPITAQMSAEDGIVLCEIQIIEDGSPLGSANFVYWVEPSPISDGSTSESDLNLFEQALAQFEKFDHFYADVEGMVTEAVANMQIREGQTVIDASLTVEGAAADAKATGDHLRAFYGALMEESASGTVATFDDGAEGVPVRRIVANIIPAQSGSGDPSPDNVRPITGYTGVTVTRAGRNIIRKVRKQNYASQGITFTLSSNDNTVTINGTAEEIAYGAYTYTTAATALNARPFRGKTLTGTVVCDDENVVGAWTYFKADGTYSPLVSGSRARTVTFVVPDDAEGFRILLSVNKGATVTNAVARITLTIGGDPTYEDYIGDSYQITFPSAAGTVYGGSLTLNDDGSGILVVDKGMLTMDGTETWTATNTHHIFTRTGMPSPRPDLTKYWSETNTSSLAILASSAPTPSWYNFNNMRANYPSVSLRSNGGVYLAIGEEYETADQCIAWVTAHPFQIAYYIEPTVYALTAPEVTTILGLNNIWMDADGSIDITYRANTGLYVNKTNNSTRSMLAGVETTNIASKAYAVGDLLVMGDNLLTVTNSIAAGAEIAIGTNVNATTVAEQLLLLT